MSPFSYFGGRRMDLHARLIGASEGTTVSHVDWMATPHFYRRGSLIVLYVGMMMRRYSCSGTSWAHSSQAGRSGEAPHAWFGHACHPAFRADAASRSKLEPLTSTWSPGVGRRRRLSSRALTATRKLEPDIESAAISGRRTNPKAGSNTPAAMGSATEL